MFSEPPILNDFVYQIPYCHSRTNLDGILNIFHRWNCQQIAIFQNTGKWGLIDSVDLLSLITEVHLNQVMVAAGRFRSSMPQQTIFGLDSQDLNLIVKPAVVYQSDIRLDEFLNHLPKGSLSGDRQKYLIVDKLGELQGKLDTNKILEYLSSEYKPNLVDRCQRLTQLNCSLDLLDLIPLPLKIETISGEDLHLNTCWQELIIGDRQTQQHQLQPERAIASWWIDRQQTKTQDRSSLRKAQSTELDLKIDINSVYENQKKQSSKPIHTQLEIQTIDNWNYIKVPLTNADRKYKLVLAIEAASLRCLPKSIANKLLAIITHELKSPLTGIVGLSNLLEAQKLGQLNQRQARYIQLIHSSGQKMMGIVNDSIELTSLTGESSSSESEPIDLKLLCREVYQQLLDRLQSLNTNDLGIFKNSEEYRAFSELGLGSIDRPELDLELDLELNSTTAISSKSHLSCILFHLMMEVIEFAKSSERLKIKISSLSGSIAIAIGSTLTTKPCSEAYNVDSSLRLAIVEYLTEFIQGHLKSDCSFDSCQFTLVLPTIQSNITSCGSATPSNAEVETAKRNLTILCLYPEAEAINKRSDLYNSLNFDLKSWQDDSKHSSNYRHRVIEADGLEQAHTLARIWELDVIVLQGHQLTNPLEYLQSLQTSEYLSAVPLITLDNKTTQAANQIKGLSVYPCLLPAEHRRIEDLMQVIQIAAG